MKHILWYNLSINKGKENFMGKKSVTDNDKSLNYLMPLWVYVILKEKSSAKNPLSRIEIDSCLEAYGVQIGETDRNKTKLCIKAMFRFFNRGYSIMVLIKSHTKSDVTWQNDVL